ncbi:E3 ubiquitin-protein ligase trim17 [Saguinus oedipus]|uniref:Tripartite motif-containing protein 5 n=1 Tax=Saguinus oedipus TaxID=9490 RepID=A0ABQ9TMB0_SAGOE|nr:E3 ubiquitin-protein ligase trim17 [Saguinus oedipus]
MEVAELARQLQEEATCSICLDYFTDPVMTACGHNFCRACIQLSWEEAQGKKRRCKRKGSFLCPECRETSLQRSLRPNRLLTKVAEMARQHPGLQKRDLCQEHQEPLKLFCQEDQSPICVVCRESWEHRLHRVLPVEEAVQGYKVGHIGAGEEASRGQGSPSLGLGEGVHGEKFLWKVGLRPEIPQITEGEEPLWCDQSRRLYTLSSAQLDSGREVLRLLTPNPAVCVLQLKLEEDMEYLREEITRMGKLQAREEQSLAKWQGKVKERRERILLEFEKMNLYLAEEEQRLLWALEREGEETTSRFQDSVADLDRQGHSLELLLLQLEERSGQGPLQMLQSREVVWDTWQPGAALGQGLRVSVCGRCTVPGVSLVAAPDHNGKEVVPDPTSAYPYLLLYDDRQRCYLGSPPEESGFCSKDRFVAYPCAVGQATFSSGRHYWEVGVNLTGDALWALGVCRDNVSRKDRVTKCPENGFWVVQLSKGTKYLPAMSTPTPTPIMLTEPPSHMGVFLDFEAGEVSFYSVSDGSHLHTYSQATFPGPLQPFFCLGAPKSGQMVISTVTMWVKE